MEFLVGEEKMRNKVLVNDVERGKLGKHLKGLVKMLITRGKSGILVDVLMEFERICTELVTTKLCMGFLMIQKIVKEIISNPKFASLHKKCYTTCL
ncbi:unnamed protein product [Arabidopsis lyrata]|uniref:Uncharacterized protein n=1 Tax=Arabidopsis lyrata subsp. lyrata TaxID=81972 RepID=D7MHZ1_ARALL|nr:hypothetical protein ARALYDRAFT_915740 [Arabidopsis lyrata subsp. lyrata]CAH8277160.1 unnamed protein product [Arabidopsis lyrata]